MSANSISFKKAMSLVAAVSLISICGEVQAQRRAPVQIGGPNGITMGGGMGFKAGGRFGVHFGGGQGARFGSQDFGMHFGNGQGARFGSPDFGMQFGGGQGARFGSPDYGMQFGHGEGARFGRKGRPLMQFGGRDRGASEPLPSGQQTDQPVVPTLIDGESPLLEGPSNETTNPNNLPSKNDDATTGDRTESPARNHDGTGAPSILAN